MAAMHPGALKVFYEESKNAREQLDDVLKQYKSNTTVVLAIATGAAAFFGFEDSEKGLFFVLALICYGVAAVLAASIFLPRDWRMNVAYDVEAELRGADSEKLTEAKMHYDLAIGHQEAFQINLRSIHGWRGLATRFSLLVGLTALVIVFSGINVSQKEPAIPKDPTKIIIVEE